MSGLLNHTPAEIVYQWAESESLLSLPDAGEDWRGFINNTPSDFTNIVSISDTTGVLQGKTHADSQTQEAYGIQFWVRGKSQQLAWVKSNAILDAVDSALRETVSIDGSNYRIQSIIPTSTLIAVGKEQPEDFMFIYSLNVITTIRLTS